MRLRPLATPRRRVALAVLVAFLYALCYVAIQSGLALAPPLRFAGLRAALGGATVLAIAAASRRALVPPRRLWGGTAALALVGTAVGFAAMFLGAGRSPAGIASVLGNTTPLLVILLAAWLLREPVTRSKAVALLMLARHGFLHVAHGEHPGRGRHPPCGGQASPPARAARRPVGRSYTAEVERECGRCSRRLQPSPRLRGVWLGAGPSGAGL